MDDRLHPPLATVREQRLEVALVAVDAAVRDEAEDVQAPAAPRERREGLLEHRVPRRTAARELLRDARHVHVHDAAGADRHVPDLGVAHLSGREADGLARGLELRHRELASRAREERRVGELRGVRGAAIAEAEAVEHHQHHGFHCARAPRAAVSASGNAILGASPQSRSRSKCSRASRTKTWTITSPPSIRIQRPSS